MFFSFTKIICASILLFSFSSMTSGSNVVRDSDTDLRKSVIRLLKNPDIKNQADEDVRISFFVTTDDRVVVLKTDARTKELDLFIKTRMNYQKIKVENQETNRIFHIKVYFKFGRTIST